jgi:fibronectin type 3 domain-containing protein
MWAAAGVFTVVAALLGAMAIPARAFTHPSIPCNLEELDTIKANLDKEPWKSGYAQLVGYNVLNYTMQGPFQTVSRTPNINLGQWENDMNAVYNCARMWYFTGNNAYAQKGHDILLAWANTHTNFSGQETPLAAGDTALAFGGGAEILRGTWPGWTAADTITVKNYFGNVLWSGSGCSPNVTGPANKGAIYMEAGMAIAVFCDDTAKFNHVIDLYRTDAASGLRNTLAIGQMGEAGRDLGHSYGTLNGLAFVAEIAWKQGVDLYSELDNRLLACGEYYARNTLLTDNPWVPFGTIDALYFGNSTYYYSANRQALYILQNAYKNRKGIPTPWIDRKLAQQNLDGNNWMYAKTADFTTATVAPASFPEVSLASSGLTLTTLGSQTAGRSASYANGVWTVTGLGNDVWSDSTLDCQFVYRQMTGDCAIVARVTSCQYPGTSAKAGLIIRDNLTANVSQHAWVGILPAATTKLESHLRGWTFGQVWGGSNRDDCSRDVPPGMPYWLKIERKGNVITTFSSQDGTSWAATLVGYYGSLPASVYIGLFVTSGSTATNTATFDNVAFTGGTGGLVTTPAAPAAVFTAGSNKAITVRWLPSFGATAYDLLRSTTSGSGYTVIASDLTADKTSYMDTSVSAGTTYYYVVQAKNSAGTSGNSPEFGDSLLPAPMANLAFGGTPNDSIGNTANAAAAFDQDPWSQWFYTGTSGWLQYDFGAGNAKVVKRYTISEAITIAARDPKDWTFLGSQDGVNWTTLDTQSGQTFAYIYQQVTYNLANTTAYRYYRLNVTANNGDPTFLHVGELGLWGDSGRTLPDGRYRLVNRNSNKVVDVTGGATANGSPLVQSGWSGGNSQQWDIAWQGNGQYRATGVASAKVIDNGGSSNAGDTLVIQPSSGATSQRWTIVPDSDGFYRIASASSGLVADVSGSSTADGANIIQSTYDGDDSQLWMPSIGVAPQPIPPAPTGLAATPVSISQINLSWTASPGAISYNLKRSTSSGGPYVDVATSVNVTSYADTGLTASTTYYYVVSAVNGSGESVASAQAGATTLTAPPAAPTGLTAILGQNQVILSWTASGGATSYTVQRATTSGGSYTTVATGLTGTSYADPGLTNGVTYYYVVVAVNANGSGPVSAEISGTPSPLVVQLKFDETGGATAADSSGRANHATLVNAPSFVAGTFVNALNLTAASSQYAKLPSGIVSGLTNFTISTWVKLNSSANNNRIFDFGTSTSAYMELSPKASATGFMRYEIVFSGTIQRIDTTYTFPVGVWTHVALTQSGTTGTLYINGTAVGTNTALTLKPSNLGTTTLNYIGRSQWSADPYLNGVVDDFRLYSQAMSAAEIAAFAHPGAGAPMQLAVVPGDTQATLSWLPNATSTYTVKRATTSGGPYTTVATGVTSLSYTDTGLTNGVTYYYVVSGTNDAGSGPDSAEVAVTPSALVVLLKFDETGGTTAADSSGRANHAALVNAPSFIAGKFNNALNFPATSSQYATLSSGIVSGFTNFTISTWIKVNALGNWQRIFDFGTGTTNYMFLTSQYAGSAGKLRFGIRTTSATAEQNVSGSIALSTGVWTHVAVTRSGTTVSLYVNGSFAGSNTIALNPADLGTTTQNYLGKSQFGADPYLNAALDDFRLYSQALSAADIASLAAPPAAPAGFGATPGDARVTLAWSAVTGATGYNVKRSTVSGGPYTTVATVTGTSYADTGVANGTTYYYVVTAVKNVAESVNATQVAATPIAPPAAPTGLSATPDDTQVTLTWTPVSTATGYVVKRADSVAGPYTTVATGLAGTSYTDTGLTNGVTYYYVVTAINGSGESPAGSPVSAQPLPPVPDAPADLSATAGDSQVVLAWSASAGATSYKVKRATASGGPYVTVATVTGTGYTDTGLTNGTTYYYIVTASNLGGESSTDASVDGSPLPPPAAPTALAATPDYHQVVLTWNAAATATSYTVKRASGGANYVTVATGVTATQYTDTGLTPGSTYDYVVVASNSVGSSPDSAVVEVTLPKVSASVSLGGLSQTYDGAPKTVTVTTVPTGLSTTLTYDGNPTPPTGAGSYALVATVQDPSYAGTATGTLTIAKAAASVTLGNLDQTYDGASKTVGVTTVPAGLTTHVTYDGGATPPMNAGSYAVAVTVDDANYAGSAEGTLLIEKAAATVTLSGLSQTYDGAAKAVSVTTAPAGLAVVTAYNGGTTLPINAGPYAVTASVSDANYTGAVAGTLTIVKATATVTLGNLNQTYDGGSKAVSVTTAPAGLAMHVTYDGVTTPPVNAGSYAVAVTVDDANYAGSAEGTLVIGKAAATVTLGGLSQIYDGTAKVVSTTTNPAALAVTTSYEGGEAAPVNAGTYAVVATVNDANYAGTATGTLTIAKAAATVTLGGLSQTYDGAAKAISVTTNPAGLAVTTTYAGGATAPTNAGSYAVTATVTDANYAGSASGTLVIAKATATIALSPLAQTYDGTAKAVTATTSPTGLAVTLTYDGATAAPIYPGPHTVVATINDTNYTGTKTDTLTIGITALVRHAPTIGGLLDGSVQVLLPESVSVGGVISGDLLVPGLPTVSVNAQATYAGTVDATGSATPTSHSVALGSGAVLRHVVRRVDAIALPTIAAPPAPTGTRDVSLSTSSGSAGDFATLRNLSLSGSAGSVTVPAGTYGSFSASGSTTLVLGVAGATEPAVYNLQGLTLTGGATLQVAGPVVITLAKGPTLSGKAGAGTRPDWLLLQVASENVTVTTDGTFSGNVVCHGYIVAPTASITISGNAEVHGGTIADRLTINGNGLLSDGQEAAGD